MKMSNVLFDVVADYYEYLSQHDEDLTQIGFYTDHQSFFRRRDKFLRYVSDGIISEETYRTEFGRIDQLVATLIREIMYMVSTMNMPKGIGDVTDPTLTAEQYDAIKNCFVELYPEGARAVKDLQIEEFFSSLKPDGSQCSEGFSEWELRGY